MAIFATTKTGQIVKPGQIPDSMKGQTIRAPTKAETRNVASDESVRQGRIKTVYDEVAALEEAKKSWNPFKYVGASYRARKATRALSSPITEVDRQQALHEQLKPRIEDELTEKYQPAVEARREATKRLEATIPSQKIAVPGMTPADGGVTNKTGPGSSSMAMKPGSSAVKKTDAFAQKFAQLPPAPTRGEIKEEAEAMADNIVIENLRHLVVKKEKKPFEVAGVRPQSVGRAVVRGLTLGVVDPGGEGQLLEQAREREYPKAPGQKVLETAAEFAGIFIPYAGLEYGAVKVGASLRSVKAIDSFYRSYPYLARTTAANIGVTAADAAVRTGDGQDYTAKDFMLSLGLQGVFDKVLGSQKTRILAQLDNEARNLERSLGRVPNPDEILSRLGPLNVPGNNFTYGHLFAEQRMAFLRGEDHYGALPVIDAEKRLARFSGLQGQPDMFGGQIPGGISKPQEGALPQATQGTEAMVRTGDSPGTPNAIGSKSSQLPVGEIKTDPKRFQFREGVDPTLGYQESNVAGILDQGFQETEVRPIEIGRIAETGEEVVVNGHNTLEVLKRVGKTDAPVRYIDFPNEQSAINYARKANLVSKAPEILQRVGIAKQMADEGKNVEQIANELGRIRHSDVRRLLNIGELSPEVQRQVSQGIIDENLAGVLGEYTKKLQMSPGVQEQLVQLVKEDSFTPSGLRAWLDIMGKHATATTEMQTLFGSEEMQQGIMPLIERVLGAKRDIDTTARRIAAAKGLGEDIINKRTLARLEKASKGLEEKRAALEFLLLKQSGVKAPKPPKGVSEKFLNELHDQMLTGNSSVSKMVSNSPGAKKSGSASAGKGSKPLEDFLKAATGVPSASESTRYVLPSASLRNRKRAIADEDYVAEIVPLSKKNFASFKNDLEDLFPGGKVNAQLKTEDSLRQKIVRYKRDGRDIRDISDVMRAETIVPETDIMQALDSFQEEAPKRGIQLLSVRNYFEKPDNGYRGVNIKLQMPNGQFAELQLHTPLSREIRETIHPRYERYRVMNIGEMDDTARQQLRQYMEDTGKVAEDMWAKRADPSLPDGNGGGMMPPQGAADNAPEFKPTEEIPGIRPSKMNTQEARDALNAVIQSHPDLLQARTRGVVSDAEAIAGAAELGITKDQLLNLPKGAMFTKEQLTAARRLVAAHGEDVALLHKAAMLEMASDKGELVQREYLKGLLEHARLQGVIKGFATEAGRAVQSFKIKIDPLEKMQEKFFAMVDTASHNRVDAVMRYAQGVDISNQEEVIKFIRRFNEHGALDAIAEFTTAAKLWRPMTHIVNFVSTGAYNLISPAFRVPVAGVDALRAAITGKERERFLSEAVAELAGMGKGAKKALYIPLSNKKTMEAEGYSMGAEGSLGEAWKALLNEMYMPEGGSIEDAIGNAPAIRGTTGNLYVDKAVDGFGKVVRTPFRLLNAADVAWRTVAAGGELGALIARRVAQEGLSGEAAVKRYAELMQFPPGEILDQVAKAAKSRVFQDDLGPFAQAIQNMRTIPVFGPILRITALPFLKTPANLIKKGFNPINPFLLARGIRAGGGEASEAVTRFAIGSITTFALYKYAISGHITGAPPKDKKLREELQNQGWQPYSIRVGDKYYSYARMDPFSQAFRNAAAIAQAQIENEGVINADMVAESVKNIIIGSLDKTYIRGMYETMRTLFDPDRYAENWVQSFVGGALPLGPARDLATLTDTNEQGEQIMREVDTMTEYLKSQFPGLAPSLQPRLDSSGRPMTRKGTGLGRVINPFQGTTTSLSIEEVQQMEKDFLTIKDMNRDAMDMNADQRHKAMQTISSWKGLPAAAIVQNYKQLKKENPAIASIVEDMLKNRSDKSSPWSLRDETLKTATVEARAQFIIKTIKESSKKDAAAQWVDWKKKKIITPGVEERIKELLREAGKLPTP